jgi:N6-adenosine-specific RNA methylase IME4
MQSPLYDIVLIDYPWSYWARSDKGKKRAPDQHYNTVANDDFSKLMRLLLPLCSKRAIIAAWITNPLKVEFAALVKAWETDPTIRLQYATTLFTWAKANARTASKQRGFYHPDLEADSNWFAGLGHYTRQNTEEVWALRRVNFETLPRINKAVRQFVVAPRDLRHSRKPVQVQERLTALYGDLPRLELFARPPFLSGWDVMGNEVDGKDIFEALAEKQRSQTHG